MESGMVRVALVLFKGEETPVAVLCGEEHFKVGCFVAVRQEDGELKPGEIVDVHFCRDDEIGFDPAAMGEAVGLLTQEQFDLWEIGEDDPGLPAPNRNASVAQMRRYLAETESPNVDALFHWAYAHGECTDSPETMEMVGRCYTICVEQNRPLAALNLGTMYYNGVAVPRDYAKAAALYKIAADNGVPEGIRNLAYCYYYGRHQAADYAKAYEYFSRGALLFNDANCLYKLGDMYLNGYAVEKNEKTAYLLYDRAMRVADEDEDFIFCRADIQERYGRCALEGIGCAVNAHKAHLYLSLALNGFYCRRREDPFVAGLIRKTKREIARAQALLDEEILREG